MAYERLNEIFKKANELAAKNKDLKDLEFIKCYRTAIEMAKWADEHPKKGLWDGEKVIEWLKENFERYVYNYGIDEVIVGLTKAMEGETES